MFSFVKKEVKTAMHLMIPVHKVYSDFQSAAMKKRYSRFLYKPKIEVSY
jgi:hypothetical protein